MYVFLPSLYILWLSYLLYLYTLNILSGTVEISTSTIKHILKKIGGEYCIIFIIHVALSSLLMYRVPVWHHCFPV